MTRRCRCGYLHPRATEPVSVTWVAWFWDAGCA